MLNNNLSKAITLPEVLDIAAFDGLRDILMEAVIHDGTVAIDGSKVERIASNCMQLLGAFLQLRQAQNQQSKFINMSVIFRAGWCDLGFSENFS